MRILKAYAEAAAAGGQNQGYGSGRRLERRTPAAGAGVHKSGGDSVMLSERAMEMLRTGGEAASACPQDATYDARGMVTRQFDSLQNDLRRLASQVIGTPAGPGMLGDIYSMRAKLAGLEARV